MKPNTPEWEAGRKAGIGASDAPVIMGLSPYKKPWQLYREKKDLLGTFAQEPNFAMNHGKATEPEAIASFIKSTGCEVEYDTDNMMIWGKNDYNWMFATFDGLIHNDPFMHESFVEIKCPLTRKTHDMALRGEIPDHYRCQIQHQFFIHPNQPLTAYYYSYFEGEGILIEVHKDYDFIKLLLEKEKEFKQLLDNNIEPERTDKRKKKTG